VTTEQTGEILIFRAIWSRTLLGACSKGKCTVLLHASDLLQKCLVITYIQTYTHYFQTCSICWPRACYKVFYFFQHIHLAEMIC